MLTEKLAKTLKPGDKAIFDGKVTGLILTPTVSGCKWILRFTSPTTKKRRDTGLGTYPEVSILEARNKALELRKLINKGIDPIEDRIRERIERTATSAALNFEATARQVHSELSPSWKNSKHASQWLSTLETYVFPKMGAKPLAIISPADCAEVLRPIWISKPETASRTRQRMHVVMQWAWAHGHVSANPVSVIEHILPKQSNKAQHQPAMPWRLIPDFVKANLSKIQAGDTARAALLLLILTGTRSGEVRNATWDEFDFETLIWTIPATRMKANVTHRIPLPVAVISLLKHMRKYLLNETLVFPSARNTILSDMTLTGFLRRTNAISDTPGRIATAHGFRSSLRDWASENAYSRDLAERALAHTVSNKVEAAYHRTDLLEQRRPMMEQWAQHVIGNIVFESPASSKSLASFFKPNAN